MSDQSAFSNFSNHPQTEDSHQITCFDCDFSFRLRYPHLHLVWDDMQGSAGNKVGKGWESNGTESGSWLKVMILQKQQIKDGFLLPLTCHVVVPATFNESFFSLDP